MLDLGVSWHGGGIAALVDRVFTLADHCRTVLFQIADTFVALHTVISSRAITLVQLGLNSYRVFVAV